MKVKLDKNNPPALSRVIQVIETTCTIGKGIDDDPLRRVTAWFTTDGVCIGYQDSWAEQKETGEVKE